MPVMFCWLFAFGMIYRSADMEREAMWVSFDEQKFEHLRLLSNQEGISADGLIIHLNQNNSFRLRYRIHCDASWHVRKVELYRLDESAHSLVLNSDGKGRWTNAQGEIIASLNGCSDVDIFYSPFTNTLAIRRLALEKGEPADIRVAYINVPDFDVSAVQQRYTFLDTTSQGGLYRYESLTSGFTTELPVDADGLIIDYPKFFRRAWAR